MPHNVKNLSAVAPVAEIMPPMDIGKPGKLASVRDVRIELARVYRRVCEGRIPPETGTKLCFMLDRLGRLTEVESIERRIDDLESRM